MLRCAGAFAEDGALAAEVRSAEFEWRRGDGSVVAATSESPAPAERLGPDEEDARALVAALRSASFRVGLDPREGVLSVRGLDRGLDAAVASGALRADVRDGVRMLCADDAWDRALPAAGMCAPPASLARGAAAARGIQAFVPGRGVVTIVVAGECGEDRSGLPTVHVAGAASAISVFFGEKGPAPPAELGPVQVDGVRAEATTTFRDRDTLPLRGECTFTVPYARGVSVRTTFGFTLVRL